MKCMWPTRKFCVGDPTQPIFHCLALGFCVGGNANFSVFRYQHVGNGNANFCVGGLAQHEAPKPVVLCRSGI